MNSGNGLGQEASCPRNARRKQRKIFKKNKKIKLFDVCSLMCDAFETP